jgi:cbb3-type cytochrome oxidase subunit 3
MLKFVKSHMATIDGVEIYPIISLLIFFLFFVALGIYVFRTPKKRFEEDSRLPLEDNTKTDLI